MHFTASLGSEVDDILSRRKRNFYNNARHGKIVQKLYFDHSIKKAYFMIDGIFFDIHNPLFSLHTY